MRFYQDRNWLEHKYKNEELSQKEIAKICHVGYPTIVKWMKKYRIEARREIKKWNHTEEAKRKIRITHKGINAGEKNPFYNKTHSNEIKKAQSIRMKKLYQNKDFKIKMRTCHIGEKNGMFGKHHNKETRNKIGTKNKVNTSINWKNSNYAKKVLKALEKRPTNPEKLFDEMTPDSIRYVGNRAWWRLLPNGRYKNPDFKVTGQNKVIEIFGDYWHRNDDFQELIDLYKQIGLGCLIIWESEIYNQPKSILEKVNAFTGEI